MALNAVEGGTTNVIQLEEGAYAYTASIYGGIYLLV